MLQVMQNNVIYGFQSRDLPLQGGMYVSVLFAISEGTWIDAVSKKRLCIACRDILELISSAEALKYMSMPDEIQNLQVTTVKQSNMSKLLVYIGKRIRQLGNAG